MRFKPLKSGTLRFIFIAAVLMILADTYLFGGTRDYIEEARQEYKAEQEVMRGVSDEAELAPVRVAPPEGAFFELKTDGETPSELDDPYEVKPEPDTDTGAPVSGDKTEVSPADEAALPPVVPPSARSKNGAARVAIIIDDLGMDWKRSRAIMDLPAPITLAFLPYGTKTREYAAMGKEKGHSLIIHTPMEAMDGAQNIGPVGLKRNMSDAVFDENLKKIFESFDGYGGINNHMGSRLTQDTLSMRRVMRELKKRGLYFVDSRTIGSSVAAKEARAAGVPYAVRDVFLDHESTPAFVAAALREVERKALRDGSAIAIGHPKDATIAGLKAWIPTLKGKGIELVAVEELLVRPSLVQKHSGAGRNPEKEGAAGVDPGLRRDALEGAGVAVEDTGMTVKKEDVQETQEEVITPSVPLFEEPLLRLDLPTQQGHGIY